MPKKILSSLIILLAILAGVQHSRASHFMGGAITYKFINKVMNASTNTALAREYKISLTIYRDCGGTTFFSSEYVSFTPAVRTANGNLATLSLTQVSSRDVTPLCPGQVSRCSAGNTVSYGVQELVYEGNITFDLTAPHDPVVIAFSSCCRNSTITNGGNDASWYISSYLDPNYDNSSPQFSLPPVFFHSRCEPFTFSPGATDVDNDSLTFALVNCLEYAGTSITYRPGFSGANPLSTSCPLTFDAKTGSLSLVPSLPEIGISAYRVSEFRNGVKIGEITRDIQIQILTVKNYYPVFTSVSCAKTSKTCNGVTPLSCDTTICSGDSLSIDIEAQDVDSNDLTMNVFNLPPGAVWSPANTGSPFKTKAKITWKTTSAQAGNTYIVNIKAEDNGCLLKGSSVFSYKIKVVACATVPADFLSFTVSQSPDGNILKWKTISEVNNAYFVVERSLTGKEFTSIGKVNALNRNAPSTYTFTDNDTETPGIYYYRLRQVDFNGRYAYSSVITVANTLTFFNFTFHSDRENSLINLSFTSSVRKHCVIRLYDLYGKNVLEVDKQVVPGGNSLEIPAGKLASGLYFISITGGGEYFNRKIIY